MKLVDFKVILLFGRPATVSFFEQMIGKRIAARD